VDKIDSRLDQVSNISLNLHFHPFFVSFREVWGPHALKNIQLVCVHGLYSQPAYVWVEIQSDHIHTLLSSKQPYVHAQFYIKKRVTNPKN
jgi:hypothetical protein